MTNNTAENTNYLVKDDITGDVYPCTGIVDVEWAVQYVIGSYPTEIEDTEFVELLDDLPWALEGDSVTYPNLAITVQVK